MWGSWYTSWRYGEKRLEGGDAERTERWHLRDRTGRGEHFLREERLQEGVWGAGRGLIWAAPGVRVGRSLGRERLAVRVSHVVVQEQGDPVGGVVQEQQPLEEAGQERGRLFHKHSQKYPGGRLEDTTT